MNEDLDPERDAVEDYLAELRRRLTRQGRLADRPLREVEDHLLDAAEQLERDGLPTSHARRSAVARFGPSDSLAAAMNETLRNEVGLAERGLRLLVLFNALSAGIPGLLALFNIPMTNDMRWMTFFVGLVVVTAGAVTWVTLRSNRLVAMRTGLAMALLGIGGASFSLWQAHRHCHAEYWATMFFMGYFAQGAATVAFTLRGGGHHASMA